VNALKVGGRFYYAPFLPFIKEYLDEKKFRVAAVAINDDYSGAIVTRIA